MMERVVICVFIALLTICVWCAANSRNTYENPGGEDFYLSIPYQHNCYMSHMGNRSLEFILLY